MNQVMSMTDVHMIPLLGALLVGVVLGIVFFAGLWWTVLRGTVSKRPALWFFGSLLVRMSIVMLGIYFVAGDSLQRLMACLLGFILARFIVMRLTQRLTEDQNVRPITELPSQPYEAPDHAPESR